MSLWRLLHIDLFKVLEPFLLLPFLRDTLKCNPPHYRTRDLCNPILPFRQTPNTIWWLRPLPPYQTYERGEREGSITASRKYDGENIY